MSFKKIAGMALAAVVIATVLLCVLRWKVWFGQPEEEPYGISDKPWRVMLTFGNDESERMLSWQCDSIVKEAWVEIYKNSEFSENPESRNPEEPGKPIVIPAKGEVFQSRAGKAAYYYARLKNLQPGKRYTYRVVTGGKASECFSFQMPSTPLGKTSNRDFSFIFVGDVQDTINGEANRFLRQAFRNHPQAEFLLCGGDLTERPRDKDWAETFRALDSLRTAVPVLTATGNHEYLKAVPRKLEHRFSLVFPYFLESMVDENHVYDLRYGNAHLFLLDSNREFPYLLKQKEWLEEKLRQSTAKWKILVCHHPLYSLRGNNNLVQRWLFADFVEEQKVDLVLQAHEHNYARMRKAETVYTVSHCSPKTYSHKDLSRFDVTYLDSRFYQFIRIHGDSLFLSAHEVYKDSLIDSLCIIKNK